MKTITLLICLVAAHIIGDFVLQSDRDVLEKRRKAILFKHSLSHSILAYILCGIWSLWIVPCVIFLSHTVIDYFKTRFNENGLKAFWVDQVAHLLVLLILASAITMRIAFSPWSWSTKLSLGSDNFWLSNLGAGYLKALVFLAGIIITVKVSGIITGLAAQPYLGELEKEYGNGEAEISPAKRGFKSGGKIIGQLERALIFLLVLIGQPGGIGFLIAAKSILRFGEVRDHQNRLEAEYIIIGTLMSFGCGLLASYATLRLINWL